MRIRDKNRVYEVDMIKAEGDVLTIYSKDELIEYDATGVCDDDILEHVLKHGFLDISELDVRNPLNGEHAEIDENYLAYADDMPFI